MIVEDNNMRKVDKFGIMKAVGDRLEQEREKLGLSSYEMAKLLNLSYVNYRNGEGGNRDYSITRIAAIADALGYKVEINWIKKGEGENG